jgi:hypothetical protein
MIRHYLLSLLLFVAGSYWTVTVAAQGYNEEGFGRPALLIISHPDAREDEEGRRVRAMVSIVRPDKPLPARSTWRILTGTVYPANKHPRGEAKVKLYTGEGVNRQLICSIKVKYFRNRLNQWQPLYKLDPDTVIILRGSVWAPLNPVADEYNLTFLTNQRMPNGQGYYPYLDIESIRGPLTVNSWIVGKGLH